MNMLLCKNRAEFRAWLAENAHLDTGIWLLLSKEKPPSTITAIEALEEALCFGWIDGQLQSIDALSYKKYFKQRKKDSNWSEKNKKLAAELDKKGLMTDFGCAKIKEAKENGQWDTAPKETLTKEQAQQFEALLKPCESAHANFAKMPPSMQKAYASSYFFGAKTDEGKKKRLAVIIERLTLNLNPMERMKAIITAHKERQRQAMNTYALRAYQPADNKQIAALFFDTVHSVTTGDYTAAEQAAWAPTDINAEAWCAPFSVDYTLVAVRKTQIVGFANLTADGCFDRLYVHKDFQRMGIAKSLSAVIEAHARNCGLTTLHADVSITAKPFFTKQGYILLRDNIAERAGQQLINYKMKKHLAP